VSEPPGNRNERRSSRVEVEIPIIITSVKTEGAFYEGPGVTVLVNKHGAKIATTLRFRVGDYVRLTIPASNRSQLARVAWVDQDNLGTARVNFGIALEEPENFWGVYFPPEDWNDSPSWEEWERGGLQPTSASLPQQQVSSPSALGGPAQTLPPSTSAPVAELPAIEVYEEGTPVFVRGISSARLPFQEQTWLHPVGGQEATVRLRPMVDIGKLVQVIFPADDLLVRARTTAVGERAKEGKWTFWLRVESPVRVVPKTETE